MRKFPKLGEEAICIIGLGYVGLPLAIEFARVKNCKRTGVELRRCVIGYDIDLERINGLRGGNDKTLEVETSEIERMSSSLVFTTDIEELYKGEVFIVTVPTPIDSANRPDFGPLVKASEMLGDVLSKRQNREVVPVIIYESTVYPGATEEVCLPILEKCSNMKVNEDFVLGYSPERINPGDKGHKISDIVKVTSGSSFDAGMLVDELYGSIIGAGTHLAPSLKVAEAAKVIENTQRDLNIALINEIAIIFEKIGIDTGDVIEAAATKWNFQKFSPGLVGGHCIGVDPYYLTHKAELVGYHPEVVLAGRRINDGMATWLANRIVVELCRRRCNVQEARVLILGFTFKEDCPDTRNTKVFDLWKELSLYGCNIDVVDCYAELSNDYMDSGLLLNREIPTSEAYECVIMAVGHAMYRGMEAEEWESLITSNGVIFDLKGIVPRTLNPVRL